MRRRDFLAALAAWPLLGWANAGPQDPTAGMRRWGSGEFRRFGFLVYDATLWSASDDPQRPPLALKLTYRRQLDGKKIAAASVKEMRGLGMDESRLQRWGERMAELFPDVRAGDHILGLHRPDGASFYLNGRLLGSIDEPEFAAAFFAIWLDPRTSAPELRSALLRPPGG
jgi:hypothetical protein